MAIIEFDTSRSRIESSGSLVLSVNSIQAGIYEFTPQDTSEIAVEGAFEEVAPREYSINFAYSGVDFDSDFTLPYACTGSGFVSLPTNPASPVVTLELAYSQLTFIGAYTPFIMTLQNLEET